MTVLREGTGNEEERRLASFFALGLLRLGILLVVDLLVELFGADWAVVPRSEKVVLNCIQLGGGGASSWSYYQRARGSIMWMDMPTSDAIELAQSG